jgi:UDP-GlcNAc3NAcA epimerase
MPEERNRVVADHLADVCLAPTPAAMANLANEGLDARAELVGDVMVDAHAWATAHADTRLPDVARERGSYVLLTLHRAENVDHPGRLAAILAGLDLDLPVIFPVHPRTRAALDRAGLTLPANVVLIEPVGYLEMVALEAAAEAIATDSGGVQKEAYLSGVPCVTLRSETEWIETVEAGWNRVVDSDPTALAAALADEAFMRRDRPRPAIFGDGAAAHRIVAALERHDAAATAREPHEEMVP